ncbi:MAG: replication-relaxation family protein, partial [Alphaproteobacteria bacterium]|nr:replication-relaxation family protein [Alphaproteobacteria bacterium]
FRLTDGDIEIVRQIARHRFIPSDQIAALVGRSIDRTNDRLLRLFHAAYVDRPRAQLDRFHSDGTGRMIYALANRGARLLREVDGDSHHARDRPAEIAKPAIRSSSTKPKSFNCASRWSARRSSTQRCVFCHRRRSSPRHRKRHSASENPLNCGRNFLIVTFYTCRHRSRSGLRPRLS